MSRFGEIDGRAEALEFESCGIFDVSHVDKHTGRPNTKHLFKTRFINYVAIIWSTSKFDIDIKCVY